MKLYLIQSKLYWENSNKNILKFSDYLDKTDENSIIVLPEMFNTGFTMNPDKYSETMNGLTISWMKEKSINKLICGSLAIRENGNFYNRFVAVNNGEIIAQYDKNKLFSLGKENLYYKPGENSILFSYQDWTIAPFICYDIRFPELIRQQSGADIMLFVASWPQKRIEAWNTLLLARSIENQCYVIGVNRIGKDINDIEHNGCSQVIKFDGNYMINPQKNNETLVSVNLDKIELEKYRRLYPFLKDKN